MRIDAQFLSDPALQAVMKAIEGGGHRALLVGGAVRNALMGYPVADLDLATDALPERVAELADAAGLRVLPTGIEHGTVTVLVEGRPFEVTTFRRDVETDGRHAQVAFTTALEDDARRRDFTINALYAAGDGTVFDPVGGLDDIRNRHLRFVGRPEDRIREDYLRVLRLFRFLAWYARTADEDAIAAAGALGAGLSRVSAERIGAEMRRLLAAPDPAPALALMQGHGVLGHVLPGADASSIAPLVAAERAAGAGPDWMRRLAALGGADVPAHLRLSRAETAALALRRDALAGGIDLETLAFRNGEAMATDIALIRTAAGTAAGPVPAPCWRERVARAAASPLPISASDLMPPLSGPALGRGLRAAERAWIASGFAAPPPALIDAALLAAEGETS